MDNEKKRDDTVVFNIPDDAEDHAAAHEDRTGNVSVTQSSDDSVPHGFGSTGLDGPDARRIDRNGVYHERGQVEITTGPAERRRDGTVSFDAQDGHRRDGTVSFGTSAGQQGPSAYQQQRTAGPQKASEEQPISGPRQQDEAQNAQKTSEPAGTERPAVPVQRTPILRTGGGGSGSGGGMPPYSRSAASGGGNAGAPAHTAVYVTKKFFIIALIIAVIVSTLLGAALATFISSRGTSYDNLTSESLSDATGSKLTVAEIAAKNEDSVVEIRTKAASETLGGTTITEGAGSGVIVKKNGYIATDYHVIKDATKITARLHNGHSYTAHVVGFNDSQDIAVIKISAHNLDPVTIGKSSDLSVGDLAVAIGNPLGQLGGTVTQGIISSLDRKLTVSGRTLDLLQTDAAINAGNSGGGLFDQHGNLIGLVEAKGTGTGIEGLAFAIPIDTAAPIIDDIIDNGTTSGTPVAGIMVYDRELSNGSTAVYIADFTADNAKDAGLRKGDRILEFEGHKVTSKDQLISLIRKHKIGEKVRFKIRRSGEDKTYTVKLIDSTDTDAAE